MCREVHAIQITLNAMTTFYIMVLLLQIRIMDKKELTEPVNNVPLIKGSTTLSLLI